MKLRDVSMALLDCLAIVFGTTTVAAQQPVGMPSSIDPRPRVSIGVVEGDTMFELHRVVTPFLLPDGKVVIPLGGSNTIRVFSPTGAFIKSYGRAGSGPGEFRYLNSAWPRGDTIEAADSRLERVTRILPNDRIEVVKLLPKQRDLSASFGVFGSGWAAAGVALGDLGRRDSVVVRRFDRAGNDLGALGFVLGMARYKTPYMSGPGPLSPRSVHAVRNDRVYIGETLTPRIQVFSALGAAQKDIVWRTSAPPPVRQAWSAVISEAVKRADAAQAVTARQRVEAYPMPDRVPLFAQIIVDAQNFVWIKPYEPAVNSFALGAPVGAGGRWWIIAPDGRQVGTIDVPRDIEPTYITADAVVGIARDEFGVESVRVHALRRAR
jgi:hypothetical protein